MGAQTGVQTDTRMAKRAAAASASGSLLEWYDFSIYGAAAAVVFSQVFFSDLSPALGTLVAFSTYAVGFMIRPLGGVVFGHIGDRYGRRKALLITIVLMGVATTLMGLLPTYADIGYAAPLLLLFLRLVQGFGLGGEFGAASVLSVEHAPPERRGFFGSFTYAGTFGGIVLGTGVFAAMTSLLSPADFLSWGWRVPFLLGSVIAVVGIFVRLYLSEAPEFVALVEGRDARERAPVLSLARRHWRDVLGISLLVVGPNTIFLLVVVFSVSYASSAYGIAKSTMLTIVTLASLVLLPVTPLGGYLSDKIGRKAVVIAAIAAEAVLSVLFFWALSTTDLALISASIVLVLGAHAVSNGVLPAFFCESFSTEVRASGVSIGQQIGGTLGGFAPLVASAIVLGAQAGWVPLAAYGFVLSVLSVVAGALMRPMWSSSPPAPRSWRWARAPM